MPTYDYLCDQGHETEVKQSIHDPSLSRCIEYTDDEDPIGSRCGAPCKRLIGTTSFKFKGGAPTPKYHH
jgi:predicted nucleic acid-binding Zn ribbon protein